MLRKLFEFLFGKTSNDSLIKSLQDEVLFLRDQNNSILKSIESFQPQKLKVSNPEEFKPKVFDHQSGTYRNKTDKEIEDDRQALAELGIL